MAVIARLQHPHIARFLDSGSDEGTFFFEGQVSQTRLRRLELRRYSLSPPHRKIPLPLRSKRDPIDIILNENPVPIRDRLPGFAKEIATTIDQSLIRNPKDRFPDAVKLLTAIH
jgi:hypothetical protein